MAPCAAVASERSGWGDKSKRASSEASHLAPLAKNMSVLPNTFSKTQFTHGRERSGEAGLNTRAAAVGGHTKKHGKTRTRTDSNLDRLGPDKNANSPQVLSRAREITLVSLHSGSAHCRGAATQLDYTQVATLPGWEDPELAGRGEFRGRVGRRAGCTPSSPIPVGHSSEATSLNSAKL
jgi:hypothetical protein